MGKKRRAIAASRKFNSKRAAFLKKLQSKSNSEVIQEMEQTKVINEPAAIEEKTIEMKPEVVEEMIQEVTEMIENSETTENTTKEAKPKTTRAKTKTSTKPKTTRRRRTTTRKVKTPAANVELS